MSPPDHHTHIHSPYTYSSFPTDNFLSATPAPVSPSVLSFLDPIERGTVISQYKYVHRTQAGRTRYGDPPDLYSNTVTFNILQSYTNSILVGVPLQMALQGHATDELLDSNASVLESQGVNITVHLLVRTPILLGYIFKV